MAPERSYIDWPLSCQRENEKSKGLFLTPGNASLGFVQTLTSTFKPEVLIKHLTKIVVRGALKVDILRELDKNNINASTLLYGLDGFAKSVQHKLVQIG